MNRFQFMIATSLVLIAATVAGIAVSIHPAAGIVYLEGTVTAYDPSTAFVDGLIIFAINGQSIDIGGGERAEAVVSGAMYSDVAKGDRVTARLRRDNSGKLSLFSCAECYIKKVKE